MPNHRHNKKMMKIKALIAAFSALIVAPIIWVIILSTEGKPKLPTHIVDAHSRRSHQPPLLFVLNVLFKNQFILIKEKHNIEQTFIEIF